MGISGRIDEVADNETSIGGCHGASLNSQRVVEGMEATAIVDIPMFDALGIQIRPDDLVARDSEGEAPLTPSGSSKVVEVIAPARSAEAARIAMRWRQSECVLAVDTCGFSISKTSENPSLTSSVGPINPDLATWWPRFRVLRARISRSGPDEGAKALRDKLLGKAPADPQEQPQPGNLPAPPLPGPLASVTRPVGVRCIAR